MKLKIAFHVSNFTYRGSESALFDYAYGNIHNLGNISVIVSPMVHTQPSNSEIVMKFQKTFGSIYYYSSNLELESWCEQEKIDAIYVIKYGTRDQFVWNIPTLVHSVFFMKEPHGFVYVGVSDSVSHTNDERVFPVVPHIINLPFESRDFRQQLGIPKDAIVFGRHGGADTFDLQMAKDAILQILTSRPNIYFIFAVRPTLLKDINHPQLKFIEAFTDPKIKRRFINTCDAMIHGVSLGESFGISVLEFSYCNRPVITWNGFLWHGQHLANLGDKAILYNSYDELLNILLTFRKEDYVNVDWNVTQPFTPEKVMAQFDKVFLDPIRQLK